MPCGGGGFLRQRFADNHIADTQGLVKGFQDAGFKPEVRPLAFFQDDYGLKAEEGEDNVEDDEDDNEADDDGDDDESGSETSEGGGA